MSDQVAVELIGLDSFSNDRLLRCLIVLGQNVDITVRTASGRRKRWRPRALRDADVGTPEGAVKLRAALYLRVSTARQPKHDVSPPD